jgi:hypothetical protein
VKIVDELLTTDAVTRFNARRGRRMFHARDRGTLRWSRRLST